MTKIKNITGLKKGLYNLYIKLSIFFHYIPYLLDNKISFKNFIVFLRRLLFFFSKLKHNKFVKIGKNTRFDLYIPGFPSRAFYTACNKFMAFNQKLPCTTVLISITSACRFNCRHCYQKYDRGKDADINVLTNIIKKLQDLGIAFFNIEGGEPFLVYDRLIAVCSAIDDRSEIWINSTGDRMTLKRLLELKKHNVTAIMFSLHTTDKNKFNEFFGHADAWNTMEKGIRLCHEAGISVAINTCITKDGFYNGDFEDIIEKSKFYNASIIQIIKPKNAGGWLDTDLDSFDDNDIKRVKKLVDKYNNDPKYKSYPSISAQIIEEDKNMFGCTAGGTDRFYINAKGDLQPCEFLNLSFGNIKDDFDKIYLNMREIFNKPRECWLCEKYSGKVLDLYNKNNLKSLPLTPELSKKVYNNWDRGKNTSLYERLNQKGTEG